LETGLEKVKWGEKFGGKEKVGNMLRTEKGYTKGEGYGKGKCCTREVEPKGRGVGREGLR